MTDRAALDPLVVERLRQLTPPGEPDVLNEILTVFLAEVPRRIDRLKASWAGRDAPEVQRAAHSLKGSSGNIGADALYELCRAIDERARTGDLRLAGLIEALDAEYARVERAIRGLLG
jgi:HPt (histidine-containing phosphotransfer) domain-containing protein